MIYRYVYIMVYECLWYIGTIWLYIIYICVCMYIHQLSGLLRLAKVCIIFEGGWKDQVFSKFLVWSIWGHHPAPLWYHGDTMRYSWIRTETSSNQSNLLFLFKPSGKLGVSLQAVAACSIFSIYPSKVWVPNLDPYRQLTHIWTWFRIEQTMHS